MNDRARQSRLLQLVQKRAVQHHARRGFQAEADVRQTNDGMALRKLFGDPPRAFDGFQCVSPVFLDAGGDRQHQRIKEQVPVPQAILVDREVPAVLSGVPARLQFRFAVQLQSGCQFPPL